MIDRLEAMKLAAARDIQKLDAMVVALIEAARSGRNAGGINAIARSIEELKQQIQKQLDEVARLRREVSVMAGTLREERDTAVATLRDEKGRLATATAAVEAREFNAELTTYGALAGLAAAAAFAGWVWWQSPTGAPGVATVSHTAVAKLTPAEQWSEGLRQAAEANPDGFRDLQWRSTFNASDLKEVEKCRSYASAFGGRFTCAFEFEVIRPAPAATATAKKAR